MQSHQWKKLSFSLLLFFGIFLPSIRPIAQVNPTNRQVLLQGFWWDYWNANYPNGWANYLTELAPRLRSMGIDAIWIPPTIKNSGTNSVGYSPFDHYDLGDKYQKNSLKTRMGDKDEVLRMMAVMKANGIDVIQDIVLNHIANAGSAAGQGGQDPAAIDDGQTNKYKNFRYTCFKTPGINEAATNYLSREGRFPKNWQNFYPNNNNACCTNDINSPFWGPDVSYESNAFGLSSNAIYNPAQGTDYMRNGMRNWLIWYKKQMGWDGVRIDAVKHFPAYATEDFLWNLQNNAVWASGGNEMFAVGEYVGNMGEIDSWCTAVQNRAGTFDFSLRFALQDVITQNGAYNLGNIPNTQQQNRVRTVPFVNNHDTYRPTLAANGNITGWNTGSQIGQQIEVTDPRASVAYAIAMAVDGGPEIFFEDLFNIGYLGNRFSHDPKDTSELGTHSDIENLIWCHQNLHFKDGAYFVRWQAQDALVIERGAKALIAVNDQYTAWQNLTGVQTTFPAGTVLKDYSGANGNATVTVNGSGQVNITIPPCDGSAMAGRRGYSVWAPIGITTNYVRPTESITQEWEMADDLGDSSPASLQQGGSLPSNSRDCRVVGRIFPDSASAVLVNIYPENPNNPITLEVLNAQCEVIDTLSATGTMSYTANTTYSGWHTLRIRNTSNSQAGQKCWVKATYTAPQVVNTTGAKQKCACSQTGAELIENAEQFLAIFPNPFNERIVIDGVNPGVVIKEVLIYNTHGALIMQFEGNQTMWQEVDASMLAKGIYYIEVQSEQGRFTEKIIKQ
ncbi:MAG: alpha-amylase domain-containing protein [Flavobacteriales bacterium]|jgi:alpha-amylase